LWGLVLHPGRLCGFNPDPVSGGPVVLWFELLRLPGCHGYKAGGGSGRFSVNWLSAFGEHLAYLSKKAIPSSRSKKAFHFLLRDDVSRDGSSSG